MAHRKFGQRQEVTEAEAPEPITFDLADEEEILCREKVNGKLLIELVGKVDSGNVAQQAEGILQVFGVCVVSDDGDEPEKYTGKTPERHRPAEIQEAAELGLIVGVDPTSSMGRLMDVLDDPETAIDIEELAELVGWLVEQYTGRPTAKSGTSRPGQGNLSRTSRRARRLQARAIEKEEQRTSSTSSTEPSLSSV